MKKMNSYRKKLNGRRLALALAAVLALCAFLGALPFAVPAQARAPQYADESVTNVVQTGTVDNFADDIYLASVLIDVEQMKQMDEMGASNGPVFRYYDSTGKLKYDSSTNT